MSRMCRDCMALFRGRVGSVWGWCGWVGAAWECVGCMEVVWEHRLS